jgi:hypothetical protein
MSRSLGFNRIYVFSMSFLCSAQGPGDRRVLFYALTIIYVYAFIPPRVSLSCFWACVRICRCLSALQQFRNVPVTCAVGAASESGRWMPPSTGLPSPNPINSRSWQPIVLTLRSPLSRATDVQDHDVQSTISPLRSFRQVRVSQLAAASTPVCADHRPIVYRRRTGTSFSCVLSRCSSIATTLSSLASQ